MSFRREPVFYRTIFREEATLGEPTLGEPTLVEQIRMNANLVF